MAKQLTFDDFLNRLNKADKKLLDTLRQKLMVIALKAERGAKRRATFFPRVRTGRLRSSITAITDSKDGNPRALLRAGGNSGGEPVLYAKYVEFGTRYMEPRLFMGRAIRSAQKGMKRDLKNLLVLALQVE
jgi:HK97 gp10 family phage protein